MRMKMNKNTQSDFAKSILHKIQNEHVEIAPKWHFSLREYGVWGLMLLSVLVGSVAVSVIILHTLQIDIAVAVRASGGIVRHIARWAPYAWLLLLALFTLAAWYNFKHTKRGYRYSYTLVVLGSIFASLIVGTGLYFGGAAEHAERYAARLSGGYYAGSAEHRERVWSQPSKGLLAGVPLGTLVEGIEVVTLIDFTGKAWQVQSSSLSAQERAVMMVSPKIAIVGTRVSDSVFKACSIIPWAEPGKRNEMRKRVQEMLPKGTEPNERNIQMVR